MADPIFQPISRPTLREVVAHQVRATIFTGRLAPGARLVEGTLAKELAVAQSTIREAILDLVSEGLLVKEANRHTKVRHLDSRAVRDLQAVRFQLEPMAVEIVVAQNSPERLDELESQVEIMRRTARDKDLPTFYEADIRFHSKLAELTDNDFLGQAMRSLSIAPIAFNTGRAPNRAGGRLRTTGGRAPSRRRHHAEGRSEGSGGIREGEHPVLARFSTGARSAFVEGYPYSKVPK